MFCLFWCFARLCCPSRQLTPFLCVAAFRRHASGDGRRGRCAAHLEHQIRQIRTQNRGCVRSSSLTVRIRGLCLDLRSRNDGDCGDLSNAVCCLRAPLGCPRLWCLFPLDPPSANCGQSDRISDLAIALAPISLTCSLPALQARISTMAPSRVSRSATPTQISSLPVSFDDLFA